MTRARNIDGWHEGRDAVIQIIRQAALTARTGNGMGGVAKERLHFFREFAATVDALADLAAEVEPEDME